MRREEIRILTDHVVGRLREEQKEARKKQLEAHQKSMKVLREYPSAKLIERLMIIAKDVHHLRKEFEAISYELRRNSDIHLHITVSAPDEDMIAKIYQENFEHLLENQGVIPKLREFDDWDVEKEMSLQAILTKGDALKMIETTMQKFR